MKIKVVTRFARRALRFTLGAFLCLAALAHSSGARESPNQNSSPTITASELEELLTRAGARIPEYHESFKNLSAEETQTAEVYKGSGQLARRRRIVSDLIIYQSQLDSKRATEFRNVRTVDNRPIAERDKRALNLFERLGKAANVEEELKRVTREGTRYNLSYTFSGLTTNQGFALKEKLRPAFRLEATGGEEINGHEAIIVRFQQLSPHPEIKPKLSLHKSLEPPNPLFRGRLWLDRRTGQIWREETELTIQPPGYTEPLVLFRTDIVYAASDFKILVPRRAIAEFFTQFKPGANRVLVPSIGGRVTLEYSSFRRFNVTAQEGALTPQQPR